jgi:hypothetical protein
MGKSKMARFLFILWIFALLRGLSPMSTHMSSMQTMHMDESMSRQNNMTHENAEENSTGSCCDEIASFSIGCVFLVPQSTYNALYGENTRVLSLTPIIQITYLETAIPPPKA